MLIYNIIQRIISRGDSIVVMVMGFILLAVSQMTYETFNPDSIFAMGLGLIVGTLIYHGLAEIALLLKRSMMYRAFRVSEKRPPDFVIGHPEAPYMLHWWWIPRNRFFNIYIHKMIRDDEDLALHDHPWSSLSLMVQGSLREHYLKPNSSYLRKRDLHGGKWVWRPATFAHHFQILPSDELPITIFITGPCIQS